MSISKFYKEALAWQLGGGHQLQHTSMKVPTFGFDSNGNVASLLNTNGRSAASQLGIIGRIYGPRLVVWGDSITAGSVAGVDTDAASTPIQQQGISYGAIAAVLAGNVVKLIHNAGIPGEKTDSILGRFSTGVAPYTPDIVALLAGTNDMSSTSGLSLQQTIANIKSCVAAIQSINALPILATIPPKGYQPTYPTSILSNQMQFNAWIRAYSAKNRIPLVDHHASLVDPKTSAYQANWTLSLGGATSGSFFIKVSTKIVGGSLQQWGAISSGVNYTGTTAIPFNATSSQVLNALRQIGGANGYSNAFIVSGPAGGPFTITSTTGYPFEITLTTNTLSGGSPASISIINAYTADGTHPSDPQGVKIMANNLAGLLKQIFPINYYGYNSTISDNNAGQYSGTYPVTDSSNLMRNGCFTNLNSGDSLVTATVTTIDYWALNTSNNAYSLSAPISSDNLIGNWLNITPTLISGSYAIQQNVACVVGNTIAISGRIRVSNCEPVTQPIPWVVNQNTYSVVCTCNGPGTIISPIKAWDINVVDGQFYSEFIVPLGTTSITYYLFLVGIGFTVQVGQWSMIDLTASGLLNP